MESILNWGIGVIEALRPLGGRSLVLAMSILTLLGDKLFFFALIPFLFWCVDERKAMRLGAVVFISNFLNSWLKDLFAVPRPYVLKPGIEHVDGSLAKAFPDSLSVKALPAGSLPSGHSQNALALWGMLATWFRRPWGLVLAVAVPLLVGFTRVFLGLHYPTDVLSGFAVTGCLLAGYYLFGERLESFLGKANIRIQVAVAAGASWVFCAIHLADVSSAAGLFGLGLGYAYMRKRVRMDASKGAWWKKLLRYLSGMAVVAALYVGLKVLLASLERSLPSNIGASGALFDFLRYGLLTLWVSLGAPALFVRLGLAEARPEAPASPAPKAAGEGAAE